MEEEYNEQEYRPQVERSKAPPILVIAFVIGLLMLGIFIYTFSQTAYGESVIGTLAEFPKSAYDMFREGIFETPARLGAEFGGQGVQSGEDKPGLKFNKFAFRGASLNARPGSDIVFDYDVDIKPFDDNPLLINLGCITDNTEAIAGDIQTLPFSPRLTEDFITPLECRFKLKKDIGADTKIKVKGWIDYDLKKTYGINAYFAKESMDRNDLQAVKNAISGRDLPTRAEYNGEPVQLAFGFSVKGEQPVLVGEGILNTLAFTFTNRGDGDVKEIKSLRLYLPEGITIKDSSPGTCPFKDFAGSGPVNVYESSSDVLSSIGSFGSSSDALGSKFAILSCDVEIDEKVLDEPTMPHFVRVDVNALYGFKPRESVITVRAAAENKTGEPLV